MTDLSETVAELRRLDAEATSGPWENLDIGEIVAIREISGKTDFIGIATINGADTSSAAEDEANGALIAALRNALPSLLSAVEDRDRLREALEAIVEKTRVGAPGTTPLRSKWAQYPSRFYHAANAALSVSRDLDRVERAKHAGARDERKAV